MNLILGAGLAGISCSHHLGHERCLVLEAKAGPCGHAASYQRNGFTWDEGPHVSFTRSEYVRDLFSRGVDGEFDEYEVRIGNYFEGHWIDHPAQVALYQVPEPLRTSCLEAFVRERREGHEPVVRNYGDWITHAFGPVFAEQFAGAYTRKYWTREPRDLTTEWIGHRIHYPSLDDVVNGSTGPLAGKAHYFTRVRYPRRGGFESFAGAMLRGMRARYETEVVGIDLRRRLVRTRRSEEFQYSRLVNTLPLPEFIRLCDNVPLEVRAAAQALTCTELLLVNVAAEQPTGRPENWIYVYDEKKLATRINCTEKLTPRNAPSGWTGVQTEVYLSRHRPLDCAPEDVALRVEGELVEMGLLQDVPRPRRDVHLHHCRWANVVFDHQTRPALATIFAWLERQGLAREPDDLHPLTAWDETVVEAAEPGTSLALAGRFGQWKYYWSDDCVLRGRQLAQRMGLA